MSSSVSTVISTSSSPITITGVTGNTGGGVVSSLLSRNDSSIFLRGVVRSQEKGEEWVKKLSAQFSADRVGKQVTFVVAPSDTDSAALVKAFTGSSAVYFMLAPEFPADHTFSEAKNRIAIAIEALKQSKVTRIVSLTCIGAHLPTGLGVATQLHLLEKAFIPAFASTPEVLLTFIRAASFFENSQWDIPASKFGGKWAAYYKPDIKIPFVSSKDIGTESANHLVDRTDRKATGVKNPLFVELEGPARYTIGDFAAIYSKAFNRTVEPELVPRSEWTTRIEAIGIPKGRTFGLEELFDSVNSGHTEFENKPENGTVHVKGKTTLEEGLGEMIKKFEASQQAK